MANGRLGAYWVQQPQSRIVSTDEFWERSCHSAFVRLDKHRGAIGNEVFYVTTPPEDVPGFIEGKMDEIGDLLGKPRACSRGRHRFEEKRAPFGICMRCFQIMREF